MLIQVNTAATLWHSSGRPSLRQLLREATQEGRKGVRVLTALIDDDSNHPK